MKAKPGHIIDEHGVERKVLGTLPLTADGCVYGVEAPTVYAIYNGSVVGAWCEAQWEQCQHCGCDDGPYLPDQCYSTREAAEAARNANP